MNNEEFENSVEETVYKWLTEDGWSLSKKSYPKTIWGLVAEDKQGKKIVFGQRSDRKDELIIQANVNLDDDARAKVDGWTKDERDNFLWDLRFELLRTDLDFSGVKYPLKNIEVMIRICSEPLIITKDNFRQGVSKVGKGILIIQWMLMKKFAQQPPHRKMGFLK